MGGAVGRLLRQSEGGLAGRNGDLLFSEEERGLEEMQEEGEPDPTSEEAAPAPGTADRSPLSLQRLGLEAAEPPGKMKPRALGCEAREEPSTYLQGQVDPFSGKHRSAERDVLDLAFCKEWQLVCNQPARPGEHEKKTPIKQLRVKKTWSHVLIPDSLWPPTCPAWMEVCEEGRTWGSAS